MADHLNSYLSKPLPSKILGIQFSLMSAEEIRKGSVAEITDRETYTTGNKPKIGGLFDPRMGVLERNMICPTDRLNYKDSPGYFGHIELARPVFYVQYISTIQKILSCVCYKCGKLLINKAKHQHVMQMLPVTRWDYVFKKCKNIGRCGQDTRDGCGHKQPKRISSKNIATILAEWTSKDKSSGEEKKMEMTMTAEIVLKLFRRISDEDVTFMGFSPTWSRPDWMICQVLAVPPPSVRPSVKQDSQQRSEDDLTYILAHIIKTNNILRKKMADKDASQSSIDDNTACLQYYVATLVDNKITGVGQFAQRSGRPYKTIKERLNGKHGRVRWNLMGKRVNYSARSVITADPNISIRQLGVPLKIAKNLTKPVILNDRNRAFLVQLVKNGADNHPGAKLVEKKSGLVIHLRDYDRDVSQLVAELENGDIIHRHLMDGDAILFNRQPTLHRMSMMCHIVKVMKRGDTFRMNVGCTKPYNADFDGDEMNLHAPQDLESETELRNLAAVPYQIVSPANNKPIVGVFQDSLLGSYLLTRDRDDIEVLAYKEQEHQEEQQKDQMERKRSGVPLTDRDTMNFLMQFNQIDIEKLHHNRNNHTTFDLMTQILPPMTLRLNDRNVDIRNGEYRKGQLDSSIIDATSTGLLHRICNDFGNLAAASFIDNLQNIVTEYLKTTAFSVGISDLVISDENKLKINEIIQSKRVEVKELINKLHLGTFDNSTARSNIDEFENQVSNILNLSQRSIEKIAKENLRKDNRFVIMKDAGSKGKDINITQMLSSLPQQSVENKRIPYGFENRTLPHFTQFDDSPEARGFIQNSYISGLTPHELFFHGMAGRIGIIDTAVKTSSTGYIQRKLIKGLEDLKVDYDMTVRNGKNKIIQFNYGDDSIDTTKVEVQFVPIVTMSVEDIYAHYVLPFVPNDDDDDTYNNANKKGSLQATFTKETLRRMKSQEDQLKEKNKHYIDWMIACRDNIIKRVFKFKGDSKIHCPVAFTHLLNNIQGQLNITMDSVVDITPLEAFELIEDAMSQLEKQLFYCPPHYLFQVLYYYHLCPRELLLVKRFNRAGLVLALEMIKRAYKLAIVNPGETVGIIAGQSIGEPTTQLTLNTFHHTGVASKANVTRGIPRIEEILSPTDKKKRSKNPSLTVFLREEDEQDKEKAQQILHLLEHTKLEDVVNCVEICFDPHDQKTLIKEDAETLGTFLEFERMIDDCIVSKPQEEAEWEDPEAKRLLEHSVPSTESSSSQKSKWVIRLEMDIESMLDKNITMDDIHFAILNAYPTSVNVVYTDYNADKLIIRIRIEKDAMKLTAKQKQIDENDEIFHLKNFQEQLLQNVVLRGIKEIDGVSMRKAQNFMVKKEGKFVREDKWVLDTAGSNLMDVLGLDFIDNKQTFTNDIREAYNVLGIEAARQTIYNEFAEVMEHDGAYINYHHLNLLCDRMCYNSNMISITRSGVNKDNIGPIAKACFEETPEMFLKAARHGELDPMCGLSANIMCGQEGYYGTASFQVVMDQRKLKDLKDGQVGEYTRGYRPRENVEEFFHNKQTTLQEKEEDIKRLKVDNNVVNIKKTDLGKMDESYELDGF